MSARDEIRARGGRCSDGPIERFREGWAVMAFVGVGGKPHWWRRIDLSNRFISLCGLKASLATAQQLHERGMPHAESIKPFSEGDFKSNRCQLCYRKAVRRT